MNDVLQGFSRALYANWIWHRPLRLLVDAGEGLHLALGTNVFAPDVVALTHGHSDHVLGLPGFAAARRFGKGAPDKPWTVLYPAGSRGVEATRHLIDAMWQGVTFPITWIPLAHGASHPLGAKRVIEAFTVVHVPGEVTLGYRVIEPRRRLRREYADVPQAEIERTARQHGRESVMEEVSQVVFAHSGDAMPIDVALVRDADLLVHDATFFGSAERRVPIHASTEEVFDLARAADVKTLVLHHLSIRYERATVVPRLREQLAASGFAGKCWWLDESTFVDLT